MPKRSAGLLMYRGADTALEVLLVHPGGPFWAKKDVGAWSIPKGEIQEGEDPLEAAKREFHEETGFVAEEPFLALGHAMQSGAKIVSAWAFKGDCNAAEFISTQCVILWPPRSGHTLSIPEVDRCEWFGVQVASEKILGRQLVFLHELCRVLSVSSTNRPSST